MDSLCRLIKMRIFTELDRMQDRMLANDWPAFDDHYFAQCRETDAGLADAIRKTDLTSYLDEISRAFDESIPIAIERNDAAIYFEYDLDNDWNSHVFLCPEYHPIETDDDDWACGYEHHLPAGSQTDLSNIYVNTENFCQTDKATNTTLFLIARTTFLLNNVITNRDLGSLNICIGFHDQNPIHRLRVAT